MISQNRADAKRQVDADQQWQTVKEEDNQNQELLTLSKQILELTKACARVRGNSLRRRHAETRRLTESTRRRKT
jgi:hypothetical protein